MRVLSMIAVAALAAAAPAAAQEHGKGEKAHHMKEAGWKEMDAFHKALHGTYHRAKDQGDLGPTRAGARDLATKARAWAASAVPAGCAKGDVKERLDALAKEAEGLSELVSKNESDDRVKAAIFAVHDQFEPLEKACAAPMKHGEHR